MSKNVTAYFLQKGPLKTNITECIYTLEKHVLNVSNLFLFLIPKWLNEVKQNLPKYENEQYTVIVASY